MVLYKILVRLKYLTPYLQKGVRPDYIKCVYNEERESRQEPPHVISLQSDLNILSPKDIHRNNYRLPSKWSVTFNLHEDFLGEK